MKRTARALFAALPVALLATSLVGCSAGGSAIEEDAAGEACAPSGEASQAVEISGDFGSGDLTLASATPVSADELQRTELQAGDGAVFAEGQSSTASYTIFNGATGEVVNTIPDASLPNEASYYEGAEWAYEAVRCGSVNQRTAIVVPVSEAIDGDPADQGLEDITADDSFVIVFDFTAAEEVCESTEPRDEQYPEVELNDGEKPTITIPSCMEQPTELEIDTLEKGDGATVAEGDTVMANYVGVYWDGAEEFDSSWTETGIELSTDGVIEGFKQALVGQQVGSTVLAVIPSDLGYQDGELRVFVLQIVSIVDADATAE